jgi:hypothetical protein
MSSSALLSAILRLVSAVPAVSDEVSRLRRKLTRADRDRLTKYVRRINERRVFFQPYNSEVIEACVGSLDEVKRFTDETFAAIENDGAKAALGGILDATRTFLDRWRGTRTPHGRPWAMDPLDRRSAQERGDRDNKMMEDFFKDLGELRGAVKLMMALLEQIDQKLAAPNLQDNGG